LNSVEEKLLDYGVSIAGIAGIDTTPADLILITKDLKKIVFEPQMMNKPRNEKAQVAASIVCSSYG